MSPGSANLSLRANLMVVPEGTLLPEGTTHIPSDERWVIQSLPGDYVRQVMPELCDRRSLERELTQNQVDEYYTYLTCVRCGRPCAGACDEASLPGRRIR